MKTIPRSEFALLPALYVLLKEQNVSRAANKLHLSQSAMSKVLAKLRDSFADDLLVRTGKQYQLSHRASQLLAELELLLPVAENLWQPSELNLHNETRLLNIAGTDMDIAYIAPQLEQIMRQAPKAGLSLSTSHEHSLNELSRGELDFVISAFNLQNKVLQQTTLLVSPYVVVANKNLGITTLALTNYTSFEHIAFQLANAQKSAVDLHLERLNLKRKTRLWTPTFDHAIKTVAHSKRPMLLTLPEKFIQTSTLRHQLTVYPLPFAMPALHVFLYWHKKNHADPFLSWAKNVILS